MSASESAHERTPAAIIRRLALMQKLTLDSLRCASEKALIFLILNKTVELMSYDRASLWYIGKRCRLAGVSARNAEFASSSDCAAWLGRIETGLACSDASLVDGGLWLPLPVNGKPYAALLLERFSTPEWTDDDLKMLRPLAQAYGGAFRMFTTGARQGKASGKMRKRSLPLLAIAIVLILSLVRLPLRIVAPCEIVAARLVPVNAPLDGVIREVAVRPGQTVAAGDVLYIYDDTVARQELEVLSRQVELTRSNLERASALARSNSEAKAEAVMLQNRLAQDIVRRDAMRERVEQRAVIAPESGTVMMNDPSEFLGRPVGIGEAVVKIADPRDSLVRIWLPQDDRIDFDPALPVRVFLNVSSGTTLTADLSYVAPNASPGDDGLFGFMAEAVWRGDTPDLNLGLKGTAVLYGERVSFGYWLLRKPLAALRRFFGI